MLDLPSSTLSNFYITAIHYNQKAYLEYIINYFTFFLYFIFRTSTVTNLINWKLYYDSFFIFVSLRKHFYI